jgi:hypothetical protein
MKNDKFRKEIKENNIFHVLFTIMSLTISLNLYGIIMEKNNKIFEMI